MGESRFVTLEADCFPTASLLLPNLRCNVVAGAPVTIASYRDWRVGICGGQQGSYPGALL